MDNLKWIHYQLSLPLQNSPRKTDCSLLNKLLHDKKCLIIGCMREQVHTVQRPILTWYLQGWPAPCIIKYIFLGHDWILHLMWVQQTHLLMNCQNTHLLKRHENNKIILQKENLTCKRIHFLWSFTILWNGFTLLSSVTNIFIGKDNKSYFKKWTIVP